MAGVHFSSLANSTLFTNCCDCAVCDDESLCPCCKVEIQPSSSRGRWGMAMAKQLGGYDKLAKLRASYYAKHHEAEAGQ